MGMKIGYISPTNPFIDKKSWSGTYYSTREALELAGHAVEWIQYDNKNLFLRIYNKIIYKLIYGNGSVTHSRLSGWLKVKTIREKLENYDIIFIPGQVDIVANLKTKTPIIYYTDGTVPLMLNYYWFNFTERAANEAKKLESQAAENASMNIYASNWARNSAIKEYKIDSSKAKVLPFGANLSYTDMEKVGNGFRKNEKISIIFSGVDWKRKGGEIAVNACKKLIKDGYDVELTIVGIKNLDNRVKELNFVNYLGFLDKEDKKDYRKYLDAWKKANILLLPTRAECAGIVFNEASAFGVPSLSVDTGGVADYVKNDINGKRLPLEASADDYAKEIEKWIDMKLLGNLSIGARKLYKEQNNWKVWGKLFNEMIGNRY